MERDKKYYIIREHTSLNKYCKTHYCPIKLSQIKCYYKIRKEFRFIH